MGFRISSKGGEIQSDGTMDRLGPNAVGVILTGMGNNGARGLLEMRRAAYSNRYLFKSAIIRLGNFG
jgi:hypothetical protein